MSIIKNNEMCEEENEKSWPVGSTAYLDRKYFCKSGQITCLQLHFKENIYIPHQSMVIVEYKTNFELLPEDKKAFGWMTFG